MSIHIDYLFYGRWIILNGLSATELWVLERNNIFFFFVLFFLAWSDTQDTGLSRLITYHVFRITPSLSQNVFMPNVLPFLPGRLGYGKARLGEVCCVFSASLAWLTASLAGMQTTLAKSTASLATLTASLPRSAALLAKVLSLKSFFIFHFIVHSTSPTLFLRSRCSRHTPLIDQEVCARVDLVTSRA
jgi:hypothetical protein